MTILIISALILAVIFVIGWIISIKTENASIVDAMWALSLGIPVLLYVAAHDGSLDRKIILISMAMMWSLRLGIHLTKRIYAHHPQEDKRYKALREQWKDHSNRNFLVIFLINATLVFLISIPFYFSSQLDSQIQLLEWIGLAVFGIGFIGESLADYQLNTFIKQKGRGKICNIGLWNYSRHPNYFFEAVIWVGIYLFCAAAPGGAYIFYVPILMIYLLTKVTGIPPTERSLLKSRGSAYKEYQKTTSAFVPWFKNNKKTR